MSADAHVMLPARVWCRALGTPRPPPCTCAHSTRDQCCALELVIGLKCQRVEAVSSHLCVLPQLLTKWALDPSVDFIASGFCLRTVVPFVPTAT